MFKIEIDGLDELRVAFKEADRILGQGCIDAVREGIREGVAEAKAVHAYKDRTGLLTRSGHTELDTVTHTGAAGAMVWGMPYASFVEKGTKAHPIVARNVPLLKFYWEREGVDFVGTSVNHPGTKPHPFAGPAYLKCERVMLREILPAIDRAKALIEK